MTRKRKKARKQIWLAGIALTLAVVILVLGIILTLRLRSAEPTEPAQTDEPKESAAANRYDPAAFYREDGFLRYEGAHMVGIDVSVYQGVIDWAQVAQSGVEFVILRVGYRGSSEGLLYEDATFRENLEGAKKAGLQVGAYFLSQARNEAEAIEEAEYVSSLLDGEKLDLPVFYDWELVEGSSRIPSASGIPLTECALAFCSAIESAGYQAGVYFNQSQGYDQLELESLQAYTLWLAEYSDTPGFDYHFHLVQYTDRGTVPGIQEPVDLNLWILEAYTQTVKKRRT